MRRDFFLLGVITALGAALRLYQLGAQSLWFDELISVVISGLNLSDALAISGAVDPPLYYFLLHFWMQVNASDAWIRLLGALFSIATIPTIFFLGQRLFDERVGIIAALVFALAPLQIFYAQEARMYSLLIFLSTLAVWAYHRAQMQGSARAWVSWTIVSACAIYAHIFAGVLIAALDMDALWRWRTKSNALRPVILANLAMAALMIPWMTLLIPKLGYLFGIVSLQPPTLFHPILTLDSFVFGYTLTLPYNALALPIIVTMLGFFISSVWRVMRDIHFEKKNELRLLLLSAFFPIVFVWIISQARSFYLDRWLLEISPALYVLIAWAIVASDRRAVQRVLAGASIALVCLALYNYFTLDNFQKPQYRNSIAFLAQNTSNGMILHTSAGSFLAGKYYNPAGNHLWLNLLTDVWLPPALMQHYASESVGDKWRVIADARDFWLVVALDHIVDEQRAAQAEFDRFATQVERIDIGGIQIYHYRNNN